MQAKNITKKVQKVYINIFLKIDSKNQEKMKDKEVYIKNVKK